VIKHLHCTVLDKFKSNLEQSLRSGGRFAATARFCAQSSLEEFEVGWRGKEKLPASYLWDEIIWRLFDRCFRVMCFILQLMMSFFTRVVMFKFG
jgi:hypothetical protein